MDGAGIMNLPTSVGGQTSQQGLDSYAPLIAAQQAARDIGYPQFTRELLATGAEVNPQDVQEFLAEIRAAGLTPEDIATLRRVVDAVLNATPEQYPQIRGQLLAEGIPEDVLPEVFDLDFFVALRIAVEEAENIAREPRTMDQEMPMAEEAPLQMAGGGIAEIPQMKAIAKELASMGRGGDTMLAHITPEEAMLLKERGGAGTINPYTGLPEFLKIGNPFKAISKAFKSVGKAVKKFAKSTVGRVVLSVALGAFLGPMATGFLTSSGIALSSAAAMGIQAGVGVFGSSLLAGDGLKNSLRNGVFAGAIGYAGSAVGGGMNQAYTGPQTFSEGFQQGVANIKRPFTAAYDKLTGQPQPTTAQELVAQQPTTGAVGSEGVYDVNVSQGLPPGLPSPSEVAGIPSDLSAPFQTQPVSAANRPRPGLFDRVIQGTKDIYNEYISPSRFGPAPDLVKTAADIKANAASQGLNITGAEALAQAKDVIASQTPGFFAKYGPLMGTAAVGLEATTGGISGMFKQPEPEQPDWGAYYAQRQAAKDKFRAENPEFYGSFVPSNTQMAAAPAATPTPYYSSTMNIPVSTYRPDQSPLYAPIYRASDGSNEEGVKNFPRKNGHISGPGGPTDDKVPAMLSDGEFVFTAKAVRNMGGGSRRKGAAKMYRLMKMLEGGPVGAKGIA